VYITAIPITKLFAWGEGDSGGHVREPERRRAAGPGGGEACQVCLCRTAGVCVCVCVGKKIFFFVFPRRSICEHGSGSGRVRCKNGTCVTSGYAVQAFIVRASFAFVRAQARMQMKCAMSSRGSTHPCCTLRPRAVRGMSIGKNQWPRDWIKRQDRWKDMDRLSTLALAFLLSCARALLRARSRARSNVSGDTAKRNGCGGRWDGLRHCGRYPKP
jgi:hypothetical protein